MTYKTNEIMTFSETFSWLLRNCPQMSIFLNFSKIAKKLNTSRIILGFRHHKSKMMKKHKKKLFVESLVCNSSPRKMLRRVWRNFFHESLFRNSKKIWKTKNRGHKVHQSEWEKQNIETHHFWGKLITCSWEASKKAFLRISVAQFSVEKKTFKV